jgi:Protein of unknown function (DUF3106)
MTPRLRHIPGLALICLLGCVFPLALSAQPTVPLIAQSAAQPPPLPPIKCPVTAFREWLAKNPAEREKDLTNRPPAIAQRILAKLQEYDAMKPEERELRLRMTELRWYMLYFLNVPGANRAVQIALVPEADRQLLRDRLQQWDLLPPDKQKEILKYEQAMESFTAKNLTDDTSSKPIIATAAPQTPPADLNNLDNFLKLPPEQRQQMYASFQRFFELTEVEKQKTIGLLPLPQRVRMALALQTFEKLPREQREQCIEAFNKFSNLSETERQEFMKNAERWRALSPAERQAWRTLVHTLTPMPPMPPGLGAPPMPPPMPPPPTPSTAAHRVASLPVATNSSP